MAETKLIRDHHLWTRDTIKNVSGDVTLDIAGDITLDADGDNITMLAGGTGSGLDFIQSGTGDYTIKNLTSNKDIIFNVNDGGADTEVMRLDGSIGAVLIPAGVKLYFADTGEKIYNDGSDLIIDAGVALTLQSGLHTVIDAGGDITLDAGGDLILDAGASDAIFLKNGGTTFGYMSGTGGTSILTLYEAGGSSTDDYSRISVAANGATTFSTVDAAGTDANLTVDVNGDITLDANGDVTLKPTATVYIGSPSYLNLQSSYAGAGGGLTLKSVLDTGDLCNIFTGTNGATTIQTVDDDGTGANLTLTIDGKVDINSSASDDIELDAGGDIILDAGGHVEFDNCAVGFDRLEAIFSVTGVIGSVGGDDTDIDFRLSNKYRLEMTGDIAQMNLIFPDTSGNFLLVCNTDGDHAVALWKVWEHDSAFGSTNPADVTDVMWAGGSLPAFTDTGDDIVSFYWDAVEQTAYGVASLAFAIPS